MHLIIYEGAFSGEIGHFVADTWSSTEAIAMLYAAVTNEPRITVDVFRRMISVLDTKDAVKVFGALSTCSIVKMFSAASEVEIG